MNPVPIDRRNVFEFVRAYTKCKPNGLAKLRDLELSLRAHKDTCPRRHDALLMVLADLVEAKIIRPGSEPDTWETPHGV